MVFSKDADISSNRWLCILILQLVLQSLENGLKLLEAKGNLQNTVVPIMIENPMLYLRHLKSIPEARSMDSLKSMTSMRQPMGDCQQTIFKMVGLTYMPGPFCGSMCGTHWYV